MAHVVTNTRVVGNEAKRLSVAERAHEADGPCPCRCEVPVNSYGRYDGATIIVCQRCDAEWLEGAGGARGCA